MPVSTIHVTQNGSTAPAGVKVMLSFAGGGVSETARTDSSGRATVSHTASGTAKVFVDGRQRDTMHAPGTVSVER